MNVDMIPIMGRNFPREVLTGNGDEHVLLSESRSPCQ